MFWRNIFGKNIQSFIYKQFKIKFKYIFTYSEYRWVTIFDTNYGICTFYTFHASFLKLMYLNKNNITVFLFKNYLVR